MTTTKPVKTRGVANKYNKGIANFICDNVADGFTLTGLKKKYPDYLPEVKTIYRWKDKYNDFREQLALAYQTHIYKQMDELRDLSEELLQLDDVLIAEFNNAEGTEERKEVSNKIRLAAIMGRDRRDNIKVRIDAIKFSLAHLAPKLVPELKSQEKQQLIMPNQPIINIISYKEPDTKLIEGN